MTVWTCWLRFAWQHYLRAPSRGVMRPLLSADQALRLGTIGGARALGLADHIGSLESGKRADIVAVDFDHPRTQPVPDPVTQLVYAAASSQVDRVWIDGVEQVRGGELQSIDSGELASLAHRWGELLARSPQLRHR